MSSVQDLGKMVYEALFLHNRVIRFVTVTLLVVLFFRFIFPLMSPFLLAFILITLFYPLLQKIQRKIPVKKKFLAIGILFIVLFFLALLLWMLGYNTTGQMERITDIVSGIYEQAGIWLHQFCYKLDGKFGWKSYQIESFLIERMTIMMQNVQAEIIPRALSSSYSCFKGLFAAVGFLFVAMIAAVLLEKDYASFYQWMKTSKDVAFCRKALEGVLTYLVTFLKAQGILFIIIGTLCSITFAVSKISGGIFLGILTGALDVLPFIGTGIILIPMALWQLICGHYGRMAVCLVLYVVCISVREFLEPKLIGKGLGIAPVLMLLAIFAGLRLFGVSGLIKGPLALIVIHELMKTDDSVSIEVA